MPSHISNGHQQVNPSSFQVRSIRRSECGMYVRHSVCKRGRDTQIRSLHSRFHKMLEQSFQGQTIILRSSSYDKQRQPQAFFFSRRIPHTTVKSNFQHPLHLSFVAMYPSALRACLCVVVVGCCSVVVPFVFVVPFPFRSLWIRRPTADDEPKRHPTKEQRNKQQTTPTERDTRKETRIHHNNVCYETRNEHENVSRTSADTRRPLRRIANSPHQPAPHPQLEHEHATKTRYDQDEINVRS